MVNVGLGRIYSNKTNSSQNSANPHDFISVAEGILNNGRVVLPNKMKPGIYFMEVGSKTTKKVVKVR